MIEIIKSHKRLNNKSMQIVLYTVRFFLAEFISNFQTGCNLRIELISNCWYNINIIGFTDNTGSVAYNQTLSEKRAKSVFDYLMEDQGISSRRMIFEGRGIHDPVASNDTEAGRSQNRRVEILILPNEKLMQEAHEGTLR